MDWGYTLDASLLARPMKWSVCEALVYPWWVAWLCWACGLWSDSWYVWKTDLFPAVSCHWGVFSCLLVAVYPTPPPCRLVQPRENMDDCPILKPSKPIQIYDFPASHVWFPEGHRFSMDFSISKPGQICHWDRNESSTRLPRPGEARRVMIIHTVFINMVHI